MSLFSAGHMTIPLQLRRLLRRLLHRPLSHTEEFLEVLEHDGEGTLSSWARKQRGRTFERVHLVAEVRRLDAAASLGSQSLARQIRQAWREFGGVPLPPPRPAPSVQQRTTAA